MDIVERLGSDRITKQFDSAGRMVTFSGTPTPLELEARAEILRLRSDNERMREALDHVSALCPESKQPPHPHPDQPATFDDGVWMGKLVAARIARSALSQGQGEG